MIEAGVCISYKCEVLRGLHSENHTYKMALYDGYADLTPATKKYLTDGEIQGWNYEAGGIVLTGFNVQGLSKYAVLKFKSPVEWPESNISACAALIYNDSLPGKNSVMVIDFERTITSSNDTFAINFTDKYILRIE